MDDCGESRDESNIMVEKLSLSYDRPMSHLQLACCPTHCAVPLQGKDLLLHSLEDSEQTMQLTGHHGNISAMVFGTGRNPLLLCSASADYVIVWDVQRCYSRTRAGIVASGTVIGTLLGKVVHLSFSAGDERLAACSGDKVYILSSKIEDTLSVLAGHLAPLTAAEFCPWKTDVLVSISEDRTFKVWGVEKEEIIYESAVLSASPLLSVSFLLKTRQLVTGSADGQVWSFTFPEDLRCNLVTRLDLHKVMERHQRQLNKMSPQTVGVTGITPDTVETTKPVLRICAYHRQLELERANSWVWIGCSDGLYLLDLATSELHKALFLRVCIPVYCWRNCWNDGHNLHYALKRPWDYYPNLSITMAGSWAMCHGSGNTMILLLTSLFETQMSVLELSLPVSGTVDDLCQHLDRLSILPSGPLMSGSPLNAELKKKDPNRRKKTGSDKCAVKEPPLVFHTKVKSSGYLESPRMTMFSPKTNVQKKTERSTKTNMKRRSVFSDYPEDTAAPSVPHTCLSTTKTPTPVFCCQYSGDGKQILCGLGDRSVLLYKSSLTGTSAVYTGHDKAVSIVSWSHGRQWWLSASEDRTFRIWTGGSSVPVLTLGGTDKFFKPIQAAQFYYLDKFLLMASGPSLHLYLYHLDNTQDDIKRYQPRSCAKLMGHFSMESGTDITAVSAINDFYSYVVLMCGADRSIQVLDMNTGAVASQLPNAHSRAIHHVTQNKGSMFSSQTPDSYNLFLSSAVTDAVKLWDLRTLRCVRRFENHVNRCHPCTAAFSPCGRFIASGSEDNCNPSCKIFELTTAKRLTCMTSAAPAIFGNSRDTQTLSSM
ncbi:WD repeat-containing protein 27 isoform X2 [Esox lucius]|uniref:WD repeat domain 27 n=1 Tax=Esox lucius TaxID=8010 RepID=A0A3P8ZWN0_ESOLU|nr:WD repeat-containing protein 27 isoform X2 [Esox lucius]XP_019902052.2 WD repeat-containing protein 27 isoform X2 [Esox lucius]